MPRLDVLRSVLAALDAVDILAAVGGSGLLAALGLTDHVRDWDVTTDADPERVLDALATARISPTVLPAGDAPYATTARLRVDGGDHDVDVLVGFAVRSDDQVNTLHTRVSGYWLGLPMADPQVWALAYRLLGRRDRAGALDAWIAAACGPR